MEIRWNLSGAEIERENAMIRLFRSKKVDGMVIAPTKISDREIVALANDRYPLVLFDRYFPDLNINHVIIDNEKSSSMLVRHLVEKGYRKIALITTNPHLFTMKPDTVFWRSCECSDSECSLSQPSAV